MKIPKELENLLMKNPTINAFEFREALEEKNIPYRGGWEGGSEDEEYIFSLEAEPDTWFLFENDYDGEFIAIAEFEKDEFEWVLNYN